jgi:hypothetical protein
MQNKKKIMVAVFYQVRQEVHPILINRGFAPEK